MEEVLMEKFQSMKKFLKKEREVHYLKCPKLSPLLSLFSFIEDF